MPTFPPVEAYESKVSDGSQPFPPVEVYDDPDLISRQVDNRSHWYLVFLGNQEEYLCPEIAFDSEHAAVPFDPPHSAPRGSR